MKSPVQNIAIEAVLFWDDWSDIDVAFGIVEGITPEAVLHDWTEVFERELSVLDHFDLRSGSSVYRVFLLPVVWRSMWR